MWTAVIRTAPDAFRSGLGVDSIAVADGFALCFTGISLREHPCSTPSPSKLPCAIERTLSISIAAAPNFKDWLSALEDDRDRDPPALGRPYSHSIVEGGFELMSRATRLMPRTSLMMRFEMRASSSCGSWTQSAVIASSDSTTRRTQLSS